MTAKSFFYACAGLFLLVAAWTMGARHARANSAADHQVLLLGCNWPLAAYLAYSRRP